MYVCPIAPGVQPQAWDVSLHEFFYAKIETFAAEGSKDRRIEGSKDRSARAAERMMAWLQQKTELKNWSGRGSIYYETEKVKGIGG